MAAHEMPGGEAHAVGYHDLLVRTQPGVWLNRAVYVEVCDVKVVFVEGFSWRTRVRVGVGVPNGGLPADGRSICQREP